MIKDNFTKEIKLTPEQTSQIEEYHKKLANLLSEIVNHTKILKGTKSECDRAVKEREYQEELLKKIESEIPLKQAEKESIEKSIAIMTEHISDARKKDEKLRKEWEEKAIELRERESKIKENEETLAKAQEVFRAEAIEQRAEREKLDKAAVAFKEALKTITW